MTEEKGRDQGERRRRDQIIDDTKIFVNQTDLKQCQARSPLLFVWGQQLL